MTGSKSIRTAAVRYARLALGITFLSAVAGRFGVWDMERPQEHFAAFVRATGEVNSFMPASTIPFLAVSATVAELTFGVWLLTGWKVRVAAYGSAALLALFGTAMAISLGVKSPLDYSVFSASAASLLLAEAVRDRE
jgi:putative oxidoreductase